MEILGLVPCQSETQYLEGIFRVLQERRQSGYKHSPGKHLSPTKPRLTAAPGGHRRRRGFRRF
jgi:hypothetical protein